MAIALIESRISVIETAISELVLLLRIYILNIYMWE